ncbi:hypothetical protein BDV3_007197 [Batrachochytrium dendrobatidis]|uniref:Chromatin modification-related protein EAF3 n=1 Tax=Batrachochytrium dendrobatidis (strain JEL423) TaxID=403673 RepID=A0A177WSD4_BATDL|nr:Esa1p-associated factor [Batrachochytrium dendrobatidis]KAK5667409.1 Esa1p-associated factor [Batrachochytrium dendrobatidis]OAJ42261.1 hypothetical protein BDEG_25732 [Batrachochytrium dendrobatidis JEL423]
MLDFEAGEAVLCFHGPLLYEAKVLAAELFTDKEGFPDGPHYLIHYRGWKASWDEWVPPSRVLKNDADGLQRQAELRFSQATKKNAAKSAQKPSPTSVTDTGSSSQLKKRRRDSIVEKEEIYMKRPEIRIPIPDPLKTQLVEDWELITKSLKLVPLPRKITVANILDEFLDTIRKTIKSKGSRERELDLSFKEVVEGLKRYFDAALGNILLYRFERQQYVDILKRMPGVPMSQIYGPEHLLRIFTQLPALVAHSSMDQDAINILKDHFAQVLAYLQKHQDRIFLQDYEATTPEYMASIRP